MRSIIAIIGAALLIGACQSTQSSEGATSIDACGNAGPTNYYITWQAENEALVAPEQTLERVLEVYYGEHPTSPSDGVILHQIITEKFAESELLCWSRRGDRLANTALVMKARRWDQRAQDWDYSEALTHLAKATQPNAVSVCRNIAVSDANSHRSACTNDDGVWDIFPQGAAFAYWQLSKCHSGGGCETSKGKARKHTCLAAQFGSLDAHVEVIDEAMDGTNFVMLRDAYQSFCGYVPARFAH